MVSSINLMSKTLGSEAPSYISTFDDLLPMSKLWLQQQIQVYFSKSSIVYTATQISQILTTYFSETNKMAWPRAWPRVILKEASSMRHVTFFC